MELNEFEELEFVRLIEKLGDDLGDLIELTNSIFKTVKKRFGVSSHILGIWRLFVTLPRLEAYYTTFHTNIFKELEEK
jgi:hypothetical protein